MHSRRCRQPPPNVDVDDRAWDREKSPWFGGRWSDLRRVPDTLRRYGIHDTDGTAVTFGCSHSQRPGLSNDTPHALANVATDRAPARIRGRGESRCRTSRLNEDRRADYNAVVKRFRHALQRDTWVALAIGGGTFAALVATLGGPGMAWDEGFTVQREETVQIWFQMIWQRPPGAARSRLLDRLTIEKLWPFAREEPDGHPPMYALLGLAGWSLSHNWLPPLEAYRVGPAALFAVTVGVVYQFLARRVSWLVGASTAAAWVLMPRVFAHAHLASYDIPLACLWLLTVFAFWKAVEVTQASRSCPATPSDWRAVVRWSFAFASTLSLAAATKFTGWLIPLPLLAWSVIGSFGSRAAPASEGSHGNRESGFKRWLPVFAACMPLLVAAATLRGGIGALETIDRRVRAEQPADLLSVPKRVADEFRGASPSRIHGWALIGAGPILVAAALGRRHLRIASSTPPWYGLREIWAIAIGAAPLLTLLMNPSWWHDPLQGITIFLWSNLSRRNSTWIPTQFFGTTYDYALPWYNTLAWVFLTVPPGILAFALFGLSAFVWQRNLTWLGDSRLRQFYGLIVLNGLTLLVIRALPSAPGHDGDRQLLASFPFLACVAGWGVASLGELLARCMTLRRAKQIAGVTTGAALLWAACDVWRYHPTQLSYYSDCVGGLRGAARLGLEPTYYWDALTDDILDWLNGRTGRGEKVLFCSMPVSFEYLRRWDRLRASILPYEPGQWRWYVLQNRPGLFRARPEDAWLAQHGRAEQTWTQHGVPLIWIFPFDEYQRASRVVRTESSRVGASTVE